MIIIGKKYTLCVNDGFGRKGDEVIVENKFQGLATVIRVRDRKTLSVFCTSLQEIESPLEEKSDAG